MTDHRVHRLTAATPDRSGYQKARADAAARAARGQTYPDQRPMGDPGVIRRCLAAPAGLHPGKSQRVDVSYFGARGYLPLGIALLWAAVLGIPLAVIAWFGRGSGLQLAGIAGPDAKRGSAHSQKQSAAQTPCAQAGLQGQEARRAGRLSVCKGSGIRYATTPAASYGRSSGQDQYGRISMRHSAKRISPLIAIVVAGCLAAGCGGSITSSIGSVPSRTATISARPTVTAAPTTQPPAQSVTTSAPTAPSSVSGTPSASSGTSLLWLWILLGVLVLAGLMAWIARSARRRSAAKASRRSRLTDAYAKGAALHDEMSIAEAPGGLAADAAARWADIQRRADDLAQTLYALHEEVPPDSANRAKIDDTLASLQAVRSAMDAERAPGGASLEQAEVVRTRLASFELSLRALRASDGGNHARPARHRAG
jgi:hypothetical protein